MVHRTIGRTISAVSILTAWRVLCHVCASLPTQNYLLWLSQRRSLPKPIAVFVPLTTVAGKIFYLLSVSSFNLDIKAWAVKVFSFSWNVAIHSIISSCIWCALINANDSIILTLDIPSDLISPINIDSNSSLFSIFNIFFKGTVISTTGNVINSLLFLVCIKQHPKPSPFKKNINLPSLRVLLITSFNRGTTKVGRSTVVSNAIL